MKRSKNKFYITANDLGSLETTVQKLANERAMAFFADFNGVSFRKRISTQKECKTLLGSRKKTNKNKLK